jgi:hypothetical protein
LLLNFCRLGAENGATYRLVSGHEMPLIAFLAAVLST